MMRSAVLTQITRVADRRTERRNWRGKRYMYSMLSRVKITGRQYCLRLYRQLRHFYFSFCYSTPFALRSCYSSAIYKFSAYLLTYAVRCGHTWRKFALSGYFPLSFSWSQNARVRQMVVSFTALCGIYLPQRTSISSGHVRPPKSCVGMSANTLIDGVRPSLIWLHRPSLSGHISDKDNDTVTVYCTASSLQEFRTVACIFVVF